MPVQRGSAMFIWFLYYVLLSEWIKSMIEPGGYIKDILNGAVGQAVTAHGWVKTRRDSKGVHFVQLNDGSCFADCRW